MGLFDGYSPIGSSVTRLSALNAWAYEMSRSADLGDASNDAYGLLKATGVPLSSPLGHWMSQVSDVAEAGGTGGVGLFDALRACQRQLASPFGRWAAELSRAMS